MVELNFMTIGDKNFFPLIKFSLKQIEKFYPQSKIYIYDWGFTKPQIKFLSSYQSVELIVWEEKLNLKSGYEDILRNYIGYNPPFDFRREEYLFNQKPLCILDCTNRIKENLIYIDGDAFLINPIDELFLHNDYIGVTVLPSKMVEILVNKKFANINAGILFFITSSKKIQIFVKEWLKLINKSKRWLIEQTSLNELIKKADDNIFIKSYKSATLNLNNNHIEIRNLPSKIYNYFPIEEGYNDKEVKIIHLIRIISRKEKKFSDLIRNSILEIKMRKIISSLFLFLPFLMRYFLRKIFDINLLLKLLIFPLNPLWINKNLSYLLTGIKSIILSKIEIY